MAEVGRCGGAVSDTLQVEVPHSARMWNYWLGGRDNYEADRQAADAYAAVYPQIRIIARQSRLFLGRAVRYLAAEAGVRQFLDVGTGLPTQENTHEVAQRIAPASRIVYVDHDPMVLVHARALLTSTPEGVCQYVDADVRDPARVLAAAGEVLDFGEPVALMLLGILGHVTDDDEASAVCGALVGALPVGSYLVLNDGTDTSTARVAATEAHNAGGAAQYALRSPAQLGEFFTGLELVEPGIVPTSRWRPEAGRAGAEPDPVDAYCGVGRKRCIG